MGIANQPESAIEDFALNNGLTFPLLRDTQSVYNQYYIPGGQSPFPRDVIIDQAGVIQYANNEYDGETMQLIVEQLLSQPPCGSGDTNQDGQLDILDIVMVVQYVIGELNFEPQEICAADFDNNGQVDILDIVALVGEILM